MEIKQPGDFNISSMKLKFSRRFGALHSEKFKKAQEYVDATCIRLMAPYTPCDTGILEKSATLHTKIGSGIIRQNTPYARYQYYGNVYGPNIPLAENGQTVGFFSPRGVKKHPTGESLSYSTVKHPQAGKMWFERMKADKKDEIISGAMKILGD